MLKEFGKMKMLYREKQAGRGNTTLNDVVNVYSYDHAIIVKNSISIAICIDQITKKKYIKHYIQALEMLYKDNKSLYNKVLDVYYEVRKFCEITKHDVEYQSEVLSFLDGLGLGSFGDVGKVWFRITY